jgi:PTS system fructose-specific IIC component
MKFVAVTSCPTGIAHSEMAAEALEQAAQRKGHDIQIEVQGAAGSPALASDAIKGAEAVIFAVDAEVRDRGRFVGLPSIEVSTRRAIDRADEVLDEAERAARTGAPAAPTEAEKERVEVFEPVGGRGWGAEVRRWLMTGVSYMIPFVVGGGILIALGFAIAGADLIEEVTQVNVVDQSPGDIGLRLWIAGGIFQIGGIAFSMLVPILAGFIAYAMADRPGIAPGVVGGLIANQVGAGFLGGLIAGLLAGAVVMWLKMVPVPGQFRRIVPILVYPLLGALIVGGLMLVVLGEPIAGVTDGLTDWLGGLEGANEILLGIILGAMMAFDMGGPVNKVAYTFGIAGVAAGALEPMAAVMAAGMSPPLGMALATVLRPRLYNMAEKRAGEAAWVLGASFITEGAIPFAAADPIRVIPSLMVGSSVAATLSLVFNVTQLPPHGGIWIIGLIGNWWWFLVAIAVGAVVTALLVNVLKSIGRVPAEEAAAA